MLTFDVTGLLPAPADDHAPEFVDGNPVLSPSQLSTFNLCPRKWAARYLHGQREAPAASTLTGTRMHKVLELYFAKGVVPRPEVPEGQWALALIAKGDLPVPGPTVVAERKFKFEYDGVRWRGSKDLVYDRDDHRVIRDHKSTSSLQWAKTAEDLLTDPQSVIYAWDEYQRGAGFVTNEWGYVTRERYPQVAVVRADMPSGDAAMVTHTATGHRILQLYRDKPALNDLPPDGTSTGGCEAFGGCKVVGCDVTAIDRIKGLQLYNARRHHMGYLDDLRAKQAVKAVTAPVAAEPPVVAPVATTTTPGIGNVEVYAPPHTPPTVRERLDAVVPPPFVPPAAPVKPEGTWVAGPAAEPVPLPGPPPTRTRGRKRAEAIPPPPMPATAPAPKILDLTTEASGRALAFVVTDGYNLCINTVPLGPCVLFSQWVAVVHEALAAKTPHYPLMGFDGTALYQDALRQAIEQNPPSGDLYVDSRTNEGRDALAILERNAVKVYRGV